MVGIRKGRQYRTPVRKLKLKVPLGVAGNYLRMRTSGSLHPGKTRNADVGGEAVWIYWQFRSGPPTHKRPSTGTGHVSTRSVSSLHTYTPPQRGASSVSSPPVGSTHSLTWWCPQEMLFDDSMHTHQPTHPSQFRHPGAAPSWLAESAQAGWRLAEGAMPTWLYTKLVDWLLVRAMYQAS